MWQMQKLAMSLNLYARIMILMVTLLSLIRISVNNTWPLLQVKLVVQIQVVPLNVSLTIVVNTYTMINVHLIIEIVSIMVHFVWKNKVIALVTLYPILYKANRVAFIFLIKWVISVGGVLEILVHKELAPN